MVKFSSRRRGNGPCIVYSQLEERISRKELAVKIAKVMAVLLVPAFMGTASCDFFKSSGPEGGVSPFISDLRISPASVPCERQFVVKFQYSDPQNDIEFMQVTYLNEDGSSLQQEVLWQQGGGIFGLEDLDLTDEELEELSVGSLDLSVPGEASYTDAFECGVGLSTGRWTVTVQLVDDNGHESNIRSDTINLSTS